MIWRLSQKLNHKLEAGRLAELPSDQNPYADWSSHVFTAGRTQYLLLTNTPSFYSCLMHGRGISDTREFIKRASETIREFTADDGQQLIYRKFISPTSGTIAFAKALNRSVTGSLRELIEEAKLGLLEGMDPAEVGYRLNKTPMSALEGPKGEKYGFPREVFIRLAERM